MRRRWMSAILALTMALALTACGGSNSSDTSSDAAGTPPTETETPADTTVTPGVGDDGVFTVGMECAYAPYNWTQMDDSNGAVPISNVPGAYANRRLPTPTAGRWRSCPPRGIPSAPPCRPAPWTPTLPVSP